MFVIALNKRVNIRIFILINNYSLDFFFIFHQTIQHYQPLGLPQHNLGLKYAKYDRTSSVKTCIF